MEVIRAEFLRFQDWSFYDSVNGENQTGVYVIWDSLNKAKPTYIGQGNVLQRIASHHIQFYKPINGYIAFFIGTKSITKDSSEIIEAALLEISKEVDRYPTQNQATGNLKCVLKKFDKHRKIKIYIKGYDPFQNPINSKLMDIEKIIEIYLNEFDELMLAHSWRNRRKLKNK